MVEVLGIWREAERRRESVQSDIRKVRMGRHLAPLFVAALSTSIKKCVIIIISSTRKPIGEGRYSTHRTERSATRSLHWRIAWSFRRVRIKKCVKIISSTRKPIGEGRYSIGPLRSPLTSREPRVLDTVGIARDRVQCHGHQ
jgi:hypothetical protein